MKPSVNEYANLAALVTQASAVLRLCDRLQPVSRTLCRFFNGADIAERRSGFSRSVLAQRDHIIHRVIGAGVLKAVLFARREEYHRSRTRIGMLAANHHIQRALADDHHLVVSVMVRRMRREAGREFADMHFERTAVVNRSVQDGARTVGAFPFHREVVERVYLGWKRRCLRGRSLGSQEREQRGEISSSVLHGRSIQRAWALLLKCRL